MDQFRKFFSGFVWLEDTCLNSYKIRMHSEIVQHTHVRLLIKIDYLECLDIEETCLTCCNGFTFSHRPTH